MILPQHFIDCMAPADRAKLPAKEGRTTSEINDKILAGRERELQKQIYGFLRCLAIAVGYSNSTKKTTYTEGWPDFVFPYRNRFICWECKTTVGKLSAEQVKIRLQLENQPVTAYRVIRSLSEAQSHLREIDAENNQTMKMSDL